MIIKYNVELNIPVLSVVAEAEKIGDLEPGGIKRPGIAMTRINGIVTTLRVGNVKAVVVMRRSV